MNESETRAEHIDPALKAAGWGVVEGSTIRREYRIAPGRIEGHGRRGRPEIADYVLVYKSHKLAVVEAKAWDEPVSLGVAQAKSQAGKMDVRFAYATNGQGIYCVDMKTGAEGDCPAWPTPDELWAKAYAEANEWRDRFAAVPFEDKGGQYGARYYEDIAIDRVLEAVANDRQRILLTLATGIIGRGTRLYDGKDYFTIYDFVKAYEHFSDPEWDGPPQDPEPRVPREPPAGPPEPPQPPPEPPPRPKKIKVKLANGKERTIQHMVATTFWHPDGTPMSAEQFLMSLFGAIPEFFKDEAELRKLWGDPMTRKLLLDGLAERGFGREQLAQMQQAIDAEKGDIFDVLAYVAFERPPETRERRAARAQSLIEQKFESNRVAFLTFVLGQYVRIGVDELFPEKLSPLLKLRYNNAIADAVADLGAPEEIGKVFTSFQRYLYVE